MFCSQCGAENSAESRFCKQCGRAMEGATVPVNSSPEEERVRDLLERAYTARKEGDSEQAIMLCRQALRIKPDDMAAYALMAQLHESIGELDAAIHDMERIVQLAPDRIADRVKLDDLRRQARYAATRGEQVLYSRLRSGLSGVQMAGVFVAGAALAALISAWVLHVPRQETVIKASDRPVETKEPTPPANTTDVGTASARNDMPSKSSAPESSPYSGLSFALPPTIIYEAPLPQTRYETSASVGQPGPRARAATSHLTHRDSTFQLPGTDEDQGQITIKVPSKQHNADTSEGSGHAVVELDNSSGGASASSIVNPSQDARSYIAIGDKRESSGDFDQAITSYRQALPTAGDDAGYVYQHIAYCFQQRGDKDSAVTNYQNAIGAYHKLIDAGRRVEDARDGVRFCERSIKACSF